MAISKSTLSILTSGGILTVVGYLLFFTSSIQAISQVGRLVGRGAILSMVLVLSLLPALLSAFDKPIQKQQLKAARKKEKKAATAAEKAAGRTGISVLEEPVEEDLPAKMEQTAPEQIKLEQIKPAQEEGGETV